MKKETDLVFDDTSTEEHPVVKDSRYNKYGVCIDCNGGRLDCLCNNLVEVNGQKVCTVCGKVVE